MRICPNCSTPCLQDHRFCPSCGASMRPSSEAQASDPFIGQTVSDKFVLRELVGSGGMGKVYRADQVGVGRSVAVKIMHRHLMGDETAGARFTNEARAASQLNHPNIISVLDFGQTQQGFLYIVYEYLRGRSLDTLLRDEFPIPFGRIAHILVQTTDAVHSAHLLGIIHRDLKPENAFLVETTGVDFIKVLDFGIAKIQALRDRSITSPGMVPGTPEYMSPEQARGEALDPRSDVYSLGIILYELLTGTVPFAGSSVVATMMAHVQDPPEPPSRRRPDRQIPKELEEIALWALAKRAEDRISSAAQFRDLVGAWAEHAGERARWAAQVARASTFALRGREAPPVPPTAPAAVRAGGDPTTLAAGGVGRAGELARIEEWLGAAGGSLLRIVAETGIGTSRLVQEAADRAVAAGIRVLHCPPDSGWTPCILGAAQRIASLCLDLAPEVQGLEDLLLAASRVGLPAEEIPGLKELFGIAGHLSEMEPASRMRERSAALRSLLRRAAARQPVLVVLEDVHAYDEASRLLVTELVTGPDAPTLKVLVTHTPELTLAWPEGAGVCEVRPLDEESRAALAQSLVDAPLGAAEREWISAVSGGHPLFVEQLVYSWVFEGTQEAPERLADLLAMRAARVPLDEREVLQWIAVYNDWLSAKTLSRMRGKPVEKEVVARLVQKGLLQVGPSGREYYFVHRLAAAVVYSSIPAEVRRTIHRVVAEHLRRANAPVAQIAFHAYEADDGLRAIEELDQSGAWAARCLDFPAAAQVLSRALEMVRREWGKGRAGETELEQLAVGLACRLADALRRSGQPHMARGVLEEVLSVAAGNDASRAALRLDLGRTDLDHGNLQRATRHLELARADAQSAGSDYLQGEILRELGRAAGIEGDLGRAGELLVSSLEASRRASGARGVPGWRTLVEVAKACAQIGLVDRARGYLLDATHEAETALSIPGKLQVVMQMARLHQRANEWGEAEMRLTQALDLVAQVGDRSCEADLRVDLGRLYRIRGDVEQGRTMLQLALRQARSVAFEEAAKRAEQEIEMLRYATPQAL